MMRWNGFDSRGWETEPWLVRKEEGRSEGREKEREERENRKRRKMGNERKGGSIGGVR